MGDSKRTREPITRAAGEGSVFQFTDTRTGRPKWRAVRSVQLPDGTRKRIAGEATTRAEALRRVTANVATAMKGKDPRAYVPARGMSPRLDQQSLRWLAELPASVTATRRKQYSGHTSRYILPALGEIRLRQLGTEEVRRFAYEHLPNLAYDEEDATKRLSQSTIRNVVATLRAILNDAVARGLIPTNPATAVRVGAGSVSTVAVPYDEAWRVIEAAGDPYGGKGESGSELRWLLSMVLGLRQSEALGLTWSRIHLDDAHPYLMVDRQLQRREVLHGCGENSGRRWACGEAQAQRCPQRIGEQGMWLAPITGGGKRALALSPLMVKLVLARRDGQLTSDRQGSSAVVEGDDMDELVFGASPDSHIVDTERWHSDCDLAGVDYKRGDAARSICASLLAADPTVPARVVATIMGNGSAAVRDDVPPVTHLDTAAPLLRAEERLFSGVDRSPVREFIRPLDSPLTRYPNIGFWWERKESPACIDSRDTKASRLVGAMPLEALRGES